MSDKDKKTAGIVLVSEKMRKFAFIITTNSRRI